MLIIFFASDCVSTWWLTHCALNNSLLNLDSGRFFRPLQSKYGIPEQARLAEVDMFANSAGRFCPLQTKDGVSAKIKQKDTKAQDKESGREGEQNQSATESDCATVSEQPGESPVHAHHTDYEADIDMIFDVDSTQDFSQNDTDMSGFDLGYIERRNMLRTAERKRLAEADLNETWESRNLRRQIKRKQMDNRDALLDVQIPEANYAQPGMECLEELAVGAAGGRESVHHCNNFDLLSLHHRQQHEVATKGWRW